MTTIDHNHHRCAHRGSSRAGDVLTDPRRCDHAAHLYVDSDSLCEAMARYVAAGFDRGEAAVVITTANHARLLRRRLLQAGYRLDRLGASGQFTCLDAGTCLEQIMNGCTPDAQSFDRLIRSALEPPLRRFGQVRACSELVNLLWEQNNREAARTLEQWWNDLIDEHGFTLMCGYRVSPFDTDEGAQAALADVCAAHTHVVPSPDETRFEMAVTAAFEEVFHNGDGAAMWQALAERCRHKSAMPPAQAALLVLHDVLPSAAHDVRVRARDNYRRLARRT